MMKIWILLVSILNVLYQVNGSCETDFEICVNDSSCIPIADFYLDACALVLDGSITNGTCSDACAYGLTSYLNYVYPDIDTDSAIISDYCTCDDQGCSDAQMALMDLGCIDTAVLDYCPAVFNYGCQGIYNETCGPIGQNYIDACQSVFDGTITSGDCPYDCQLGLTSYLDYMWPDIMTTTVSDYCDCDDDTNCDLIGGVLESLGCIDYEECGYVFEYKCMTDPDCAPIGEFYIEACAPIFNGSLTSGTCPSECAYGLTSYLNYMWPDQTSTDPDDYCLCDSSNPECETIGNVLQSLGCIDYSILNDCSSVFNYHCQGIYNETCGPIGRDYLNSCQMILDGSMTTGDCPYECQLGLTRYLDEVWPDVDSTMVADYCTCSDTDCSDIGGYLENMGCIDKNECGYVFNYVCGTDPDCAPIGEAYLDACQYIINGSVTSGTCSDECRWELTAYLDYLYPDVDSDNPDDYCTCGADNGDCEGIGDVLMDMGCIDKTDCTYVWNKCQQDPDCVTISTQYFTDCQQFVEMTYDGSSLSECPAACDDSLTAYLEYNFGIEAGKSVDEYCNCNGGTECTTILGWYDDLGCGEIPEPTTSDDETGPSADPSGASTFAIQISFILAIVKALVI